MATFSNLSIADELAWLVSWEINVPFQHKIGYYRGQNIASRISGLLRPFKSNLTGDRTCLLLAVVSGLS